jgi:hypothetical protein
MGFERSYQTRILSKQIKIKNNFSVSLAKQVIVAYYKGNRSRDRLPIT